MKVAEQTDAASSGLPRTRDSMAPSGVPSGEAEEMQRARDEEREHALACVDAVNQDSQNGFLARIRTYRSVSEHQALALLTAAGVSRELLTFERPYHLRDCQ